jgi:hypothetical protein
MYTRKMNTAWRAAIAKMAALANIPNCARYMAINSSTMSPRIRIPYTAV